MNPYELSTLKRLESQQKKEAATRKRREKLIEQNKEMLHKKSEKERIIKSAKSYLQRRGEYGSELRKFTDDEIKKFADLMLRKRIINDIQDSIDKQYLVSKMPIISSATRKGGKNKKKGGKRKTLKRKKSTPTLLQQIKDNSWMEDILKKKANNKRLTDYDKFLFNMMKQQPLPPGGMTKLVKKYKKK